MLALWRFGMRHRVVPFLIVGALSTLCNLFMLFMLTHFAGLWYIYSELCAFCISYGVTFTLHRVWTFRGSSKSKMSQIMLHLPFQILTLAADESMLYVLVEYAGLWYPLGQFITSSLLAGISFFATRYIFAAKTSPVT